MNMKPGDLIMWMYFDPFVLPEDSVSDTGIPVPDDELLSVEAMSDYAFIGEASLVLEADDRGNYKWVNSKGIFKANSFYDNLSPRTTARNYLVYPCVIDHETG
jgi:hypothetical protein